MLDFRKAIFAIAVAGLGLAGTASAQVIGCTLNPVTQIGVRAEGQTEQLPPITISGCTGTTDSTSISVTMTSSAPITNPLLTGSSSSTNAVGWLSSGAFSASKTGPTNPVAGVVNTAANTLTFTFSGISVGTSSTGAIITLQNIRVNASTLGGGVTITESATAATLGLAFSGATNSAGPIGVALTQTSLAKPGFTAYANVAICNVKPTDVNAVGVVSISDGPFDQAFTTDAQELAKETGANGALNITGDANTGTNTVGSRIALIFNNLSPGVTYYLPVSVASAPSTAGVPLTLSLVGSPSTPLASSGALAGGSIGGATNCGNTTTSQTGYSGTCTVLNAVTIMNVYGFTPSATGSFTAYYAVTNDNNTGSSLSSLADSTGTTTSSSPVATTSGPVITLYEIVPSNTVTLPAAAPTVSASLQGAAAPNFAQFSATNTTATATAATTSGFTPAGNGLLVGCNTTLLFPYVVNVSGYDTGVSIANAGLGTTVAGNTITSSSGTCTLQLWGSATVNGTAIANPFFLNPITVPMGTDYLFTLSGALASATNTAGAGGFVGYMVAQCNFQGGHGFAFITNGFGMAAGADLAEGYLADILIDTFGTSASPVAIQNPE